MSPAVGDREHGGRSSASPVGGLVSAVAGPHERGGDLTSGPNQFFTLQESTLNYGSTLLSFLQDSASAVVKIRFASAT